MSFGEGFGCYKREVVEAVKQFIGTKLVFDKKMDMKGNYITMEN